MADKSRLQKSRGVYRGQVTRLQRKIQDLFGSAELTQDDCDSLESSVSSLPVKLEIIKDIDKQILDLLSDEEFETFLTESADYVTDVEQYILTHEKKVRRVSAKSDIVNTSLASADQPADPGDIVSSASASAQQLANPRHTFNLPKLSLKTFNGDLLQWLGFYDSFRSGIDSDSRLSDVQKFQYLCAQLSGEAADLVSGLPLSDSNYSHAISLLKKRYGQTDELTDTYMRALWELPPPEYTVDSLRNFHDRLESYIRGLQTLDISTESYGSLLVPVIMDKLPPRYCEQITRSHHGKWTINDLQTSFQQEIKALRASNRIGNLSISEGDHHATAAFYTRTSHPSKPKSKNYSPGKQFQTPSCAYCKGVHYSGDCVVITDKQKRQQIVIRDKLCFNCLGKHRAADCKSAFRCRNCKRKHHTSLCTGVQTKPSETMDDQKSRFSQKPQNSGEQSKPTDTKVSLANIDGPILLKTAIADISANQNCETVALLFDEGAQRTFITQSTADTLDLKPVRKENIHLSVFGEQSGTRSLPVVQFMLHTKDNSCDLIIHALVVPRISTPMRNYITKSVIELPHLRALKLAHPYTRAYSEDISVLIGADYYWDIVGNHIVRGDGPTAMSSSLGYLLSGPYSTLSDNHRTPQSTLVHHVNVDIHSHQLENIDLQRFWDLESIGVNGSELDAIRGHMEYHQTHIHKDNGRYIAKLPWRQDHEPLPTNKNVAEKRTRSMVQRLSPELRDAYDNIICEQLDSNFIERVVNDDTMSGHYLPHRGVSKESSSTPLRIVYDCSSAVSGKPSLNNCLETGPSLLNDLSSILLRFRLHAKAITADIEKAFLQIGLDPDDRKYTKFFWLSDPQDPNSKFDTYQFKVILFGAVCSPFILNATVRNHLEQYSSATTQDILENIYVDNIVSGCGTTWDILHYYDEANAAMASGGFRLRCWSTNCNDLRDYMEQDKLSSSEQSVNVLGITWDTTRDKLSYRDYIVSTDEHFTKRTIVQSIARFFDPLGYITPVQVRAKIFVQQLWKSGYDWDVPLPDDLMSTWRDIIHDLDLASATDIDRTFFYQGVKPTATYELHAFADASKSAYGCAVYLLDKATHQTALVMAKSRVAPTRELTIPQLELLAVFIASGLLQFVHNGFGSYITISKRVIWTDSQIVLHWIRSDKRLTVFVSNRVKVIRSRDVSDFKYCPSADNPADMISRGVTFSVFSNSPIWWNGPAWLKHGDWPICQLFDSAVFNIEIKSELNQLEDNDRYKSESALASAPTTSAQSAANSSFINPEDYSSLKKLIRVTALVLRFVRCLRDKKQSSVASLSTEELTAAETFWILRVQREHYANELSTLCNDKRSGHTTLIKQLRLFRDTEGMLRVGGRLHNAPLTYDTQFPILLPSASVYTKLVILDTHKRTHHMGTESTITLLRQTYWVTKMRRAVKSVLRTCFQCKLITGLSYALPPSAPLQECRLRDSSPFTVTGIDYTGALYVRSNTSVKGESKVYILLFTCASTRAVHLEVTTDLTVASFLNAFRRFVARRSLPSKILSDNASTFLSARSELNQLLSSTEFRNFMTDSRLTWSTIPQGAPWHGGFWERLIGLTKTTIKKVLGRAFVTLDDLKTIVAEVETSINNRPLTYLSSDIDDLTPLTPSHLLHGRVLTTLPHMQVDDEELSDPTFSKSHAELNKSTIRLATLHAHFQKRWANEYVTALRERHLQSQRATRNSNSIIKIGDVVLVHDDRKPRLNWNLACVIDLVKGRDSLVRSAKIKTKQGVTFRPINKLCPLEVSAPEELSSPSIDTPPTLSSNPISCLRTPRKAGLEAKDRIRIIAKEYDS